MARARVREVSRAGERAAVRHVDGREWPLALEAYRALALPGAGAPPNVSDLKDEAWREAWETGQLHAYEDWAYDTPSGMLELGDYYLADGRLRINLGEGIAVLEQGEFSGRGATLRVEDVPTRFGARLAATVDAGEIRPIIRGGAIGVGNATISALNTTATSITFSHNNNGTVLVVGCGCVGDQTSATYAGSAMTSTVERTTAEWGISLSIRQYRHASPAAGANNVVCTIASSAPLIAGAVSLTGADTSSPVRATNEASNASTGTTATTTVTTDAADMIVDTWLEDGTANPTIGADQTSRVAGEHTAGAEFRMSSQPGSAGGVMSWTWSGSTGWAIVAASYKEAATGASGTGAGTFPAFSGSATGEQTQAASAAGTFPALTGAAVGAELPSATAAGTFPALTASAVGEQSQVGTAAGTFAALVGDASGTQGSIATAAGTFPAVVGTAAGTQTVSGSAAATLPSFTGLASGTQTASATGAGTFPAVTGSASGTHTPAGGTPEGAGAGMFPAVVGTASGVMLPSGTGAGVFAALVGAAAGSHTRFEAAGAGTFAALVGSGSGAQTQAATAAGIFAALLGDGTGGMLPSGVGAGAFGRLTGSALGQHGVLIGIVVRADLDGQRVMVSDLAGHGALTDALDGHGVLALDLE